MKIARIWRGERMDTRGKHSSRHRQNPCNHCRSSSREVADARDELARVKRGANVNAKIMQEQVAGHHQPPPTCILPPPLTTTTTSTPPSPPREDHHHLYTTTTRRAHVVVLEGGSVRGESCRAWLLPLALVLFWLRQSRTMPLQCASVAPVRVALPVCLHH